MTEKITIFCQLIIRTLEPINKLSNLVPFNYTLLLRIVCFAWLRLGWHNTMVMLLVTLNTEIREPGTPLTFLWSSILCNIFHQEFLIFKWHQLLRPLGIFEYQLMYEPMAFLHTLTTFQNRLDSVVLRQAWRSECGSKIWQADNLTQLTYFIFMLLIFCVLRQQRQPISFHVLIQKKFNKLQNTCINNVFRDLLIFDLE